MRSGRFVGRAGGAKNEGNDGNGNVGRVPGVAGIGNNIPVGGHRIHRLAIILY